MKRKRKNMIHFGGVNQQYESKIFNDVLFNLGHRLGIQSLVAMRWIRRHTLALR